jgi:threonine dehydratase
VRVVGVQVDACAPFPGSLRAGEALEARGGATIADGIAVKRPGELTFPLVRRWVDDMVVVAEDDVAEAMVLLLERAKLVVEGAGAVGVAALLSGALRPASRGATGVVLSGGNVDAGLLAAVARRHETAVGRRLRIFTRISDRPGGLAGLLGLVANAGGNLITVEHVREAVPLHVRQTGVHLVLETRGADHAREIVAALRVAGYELEQAESAGAPQPRLEQVEFRRAPCAGLERAESPRAPAPGLAHHGSARPPAPGLEHDESARPPASGLESDGSALAPEAEVEWARPARTPGPRTGVGAR